MSQHEEDEPVVRVRRKTALPARYEEYDLSGFTLPRLYPEPMSSHPQFHPTVPSSTEPEEGAAGIAHPSPLRKEPDSLQRWSDVESWDSETSILKRENRNLRLAHDNLLHTLQAIQQERDTFQQATDQYSQELLQLKRQMQQLQIQLEQQQPAAQSSPLVAPMRPVPAPRSLPRTRQSDRSFTSVSAPRPRSIESDQPEHSSEAPAAAPRAKLHSPHHTSHTENVKWDASREERTYYSRAETPDRPSRTSYEPESAVPPSFESARRSHLPCRASSPVPPELEPMYQGPTPTIPDFVHPNPREFSRLKIALENSPSYSHGEIQVPDTD